MPDEPDTCAPDGVPPDNAFAPMPTDPDGIYRIALRDAYIALWDAAEMCVIDARLALLHPGPRSLLPERQRDLEKSFLGVLDAMKRWSEAQHDEGEEWKRGTR